MPSYPFVISGLLASWHVHENTVEGRTNTAETILDSLRERRGLATTVNDWEVKEQLPGDRRSP